MQVFLMILPHMILQVSAIVEKSQNHGGQNHAEGQSGDHLIFRYPGIYFGFLRNSERSDQEFCILQIPGWHSITIIFLGWIQVAHVGIGISPASTLVIIGYIVRTLCHCRVA